MMITVFSIIAIALYLLGGLLLAVRLFRSGQGQPRTKAVPIIFGLVAVCLHALILNRTIVIGPALNLGFANAASLIGGLIALLLLLAAIVRPLENLGIAILPMAALTLGVAVFVPAAQVLVTPSSPGMEVHILLSIIAYSLLSIAAIQAVLLAIQETHLRNRRPGGFIRALPPLQAMETLLFQMIGLGFLLLTLALLGGFVYVQDVFAQHLVHKTVLSILAWLVFAILLWGRRALGWRGRTAVRWTLAGFATLMLAYFGSKLVLEIILQKV